MCSYKIVLIKKESVRPLTEQNEIEEEREADIWISHKLSKLQTWCKNILNTTLFLATNIPWLMPQIISSKDIATSHNCQEDYVNFVIGHFNRMLPYMFFLQECDLEESSTRLLENLRKFSTELLRPKNADMLTYTGNSNLRASLSSPVTNFQRFPKKIYVFQ